MNQLDEVFIGINELSCEYGKGFFKSLKKWDNSELPKLFKNMRKVLENPNGGKHMSGNRKGQQELYVAHSFRLYYYYFEKENLVFFYELSHKDNQ